ncbi:hypothetical protein [Candidatus Nitrospira bockiana]
MRFKISLIRFALAALAPIILFSPPLDVSGETWLPEGWIDKLSGFVLIQRGIEREGSFEPYLGQLLLVRHTLRRQELHGAYVALNRFMEMLETREAGIRPEVAEAIWDFCYQATPTAFHDEQRHKRRWDQTVEWEQFFWEE